MLSSNYLFLSSSCIPEASSCSALAMLSLSMLCALTMMETKDLRVTLPSLFFSHSFQSSSATSGLNYGIPAFFWQMVSRACFSSR